MRAWILSACVLAGCLHDRIPTIAAHDAPHSAAQDAWKEYFLDGNYEMAAMTARRAALDPMLIGLAFQEARKEAKKHLRVFYTDFETDNEVLLKNIQQAYRTEVAIACLYGPKRSSGRLAIRDVEAASERLNSDMLLYLLLDYECPLNREERFEIILAAVQDDRNAYALKMALVSGWNVLDKLAFVDLFLSTGDCSFGFKAAARLKPDTAYLAQLIRDSSCENDPFDSKGWRFPQNDLRYLFFEAVRYRKYHLALEFNLLAQGGENGVRYLVQQIFDRHDEYTVEGLCVARPELRPAIYGHALSLGRARFVGMHSKDIFWQERAFEKLLEEGKFDDAAEVAEFGISETLRTEGVLKAFRAAVVAGDMIDARYLRRRYPQIVPKKEYEKAEAAWIKSHPDDTRFGRSRKRSRRKKNPECTASASGEWTVKRCDE
jgi:hypothetical protein